MSAHQGARHGRPRVAPDDETVRIHVRVPRRILVQLGARSELSGVTLSELVRGILDREISSAEPEAPSASRR